VTGYGLVEVAAGGRMICRLAGQIAPPSGWPLPRRLEAVFQGLTELILKHEPQEMAVEDIYFARNARSALALGHVRGVVLLAAAQSRLPVETYTASAIKKAVVGYGRAGKEQVGRMVCSLLSLNQALGQDVTDALACAVCHLNTSATARRIAAAGEGR
jgi:crossover junction endodeoxyribonuclease RuvC